MIRSYRHIERGAQWTSCYLHHQLQVVESEDGLLELQDGLVLSAGLLGWTGLSVEREERDDLPSIRRRSIGIISPDRLERNCPPLSLSGEAGQETQKTVEGGETQ